MGRYAFPANVPNIPFHHWSAGVVLATSIAHKGAVAGAKALAGAVVDLFKTPARVEEAKETFSRELGGITYEPLLPASQTPPLDLNRDAMEFWRPKMRSHYVSERPVFKR
jgi:aminobenzoyl-glutamate utilization protein B